MDVAYTSEDCRLFSMALDYAWDIFLKSRGLTSKNVDTAKAALTYAIFHSAREGERNPRKPAIAAVARIDHFHPNIEIQRSFTVQSLR